MENKAVWKGADKQKEHNWIADFAKKNINWERRK